MSEAQEIYRDWVAQKSDVPIFFQAWWLDIMCKDPSNWDVILIRNPKDQRVEGIFTYYQKHRLGIRGIDMPPLTPMMGPLIFLPDGIQKKHSIHSYEIRVLKKIIEQLPNPPFFKQKWSWQLTNHLPFYWEDYRIQTNYTYLFSDLSDLDFIWNSFANNIRGRIKQKSKQFDIIIPNDASRLFQLQQQRLEAQKITIPISEEQLEKLYTTITKKTAGTIFEARTHNGETAAAIMIVCDQQEAYLLLSAYGKGGKSGAMPVLIWHAIKTFSARVKRFNFEGSMLPGVEQFFRAFGAELTPYYQLSKLNIPLLDKWFKKLG